MKRLLIACGVATGVVMMAGCNGAGKSDSEAQAAGPDTVEILSYNIRLSFADDGDNSWKFRKPASLVMIGEEKPVVFGLQEACPEQLKYLNDSLAGYEYIGVGRDDGKTEGEAMAVFFDTSRVDLGENGTFWLSETPDSVSFGWDAACRRTCTWAKFTLKDSGREFYVFNTHLDHIGPTARRESIRLIADSIKAIAGGETPCFLTADFNTTAADSIFDPVKQILGQARVDSPVSDSHPTYNAYGRQTEYATDGDCVIDHIFYKGMEPISFRTLTGDYGVPYISDHYPIAFTAVIK